MTRVDCYRLIGIYETPSVRIATVLTCEVRDCGVTVASYSDGRIPWERRASTPIRPQLE